MRATAFVLACSACTACALRGTSREVRRWPRSGDPSDVKTTKALALALMSTRPAAAWQVRGSDHVRRTMLRTSGSPWRHGQVVAQGRAGDLGDDGIDAFPGNPLMDELGDDDDDWDLSDLAMTALVKDKLDEGDVRAEKSSAFSQKVTEKPAREMEEMGFFEQDDQKMGNLADVDPEEQSQAKLDLNEAIRKDNYDDKQGGIERWTSEDEADLDDALKSKIKGGDALTQRALQSGAFGASDDKYYEKVAGSKSEKRVKQERENAMFLEEKKQILKDTEDWSADKMAARVQATTEGRTVQKGFYQSANYWETEWGSESIGERQDEIERTGLDAVYEEIKIDKVESKAAISQGFSSKGDMTRSKDKSLAKAFGSIGGDVQELVEEGGNTDKFEQEGIFSGNRDGVDFDAQMQKLIDMRDQLTPEEWGLVFGSDEDPEYF